MQVMLDIIGSADDYARGIRDNRIYGQQSEIGDGKGCSSL
jgi:ATP-binding cassette subfamily B protein